MEQTSYRKHFILILVLILSLLTFYAACVYLIDPLQQYRLAKLYKPVYINEIYQNPGLAKNYEYDSVIIGSSMTENFSTSYIHKRLGLNILKLSFSGANSFECKVMLETAINTGKVHNVIYGVDIFRLAGKSVRVGFPDYLYNHQSGLSNIKYLLNIGHLGFIFKAILANAGIAYKDKLNFDDAFMFKNMKAFSAEKVMATYKDMVSKSNPEAYSLLEMKDNFNKNVLAILKNNPRINFYLFFPPYSIYTYKLYEHEGNLDKFFEMKRYVANSVKDMPNVMLYDFQVESRITKNLNNYRNLTHYSSLINDYMIDNLKNNKYLLTEKNTNKFIDRLLTDINQLKI